MFEIVHSSGQKFTYPLFSSMHGLMLLKLQCMVLSLAYNHEECQVARGLVRADCSCTGSLPKGTQSCSLACLTLHGVVKSQSALVRDAFVLQTGRLVCLTAVYTVCRCFFQICM